MKNRKFRKEELSEALRAISSLIGKLAKVKPKLRKGSPQATLLARRLKALRIASILLKQARKR